MYQASEFHWWQLITAHLYHYDWMHLGLNLMALIMLLYLIPANAKQKLSVCLTAIATIDGYLLLSDVKFYAGFSGVNYALIGLACYQLLGQKKVKKALLISVILFVYLFLFSEKQHQTQSIVWHSLKQAHVLGFVSGLIFSRLIKQLLVSLSAKRDLSHSKPNKTKSSKLKNYNPSNLENGITP